MPRGKQISLDVLSFLSEERRQEVMEEALGNRLRGVFERNGGATLGKLVDDLTGDDLWTAMQHVPVSAVLRPGNASSSTRQTGARRGRPPGRRTRGGVTSDSLDQIVDFIKKHPGLRSEQIQAELQLGQGVVKAGLAKLRAANRVKTNGQRRSTTYSTS